MLLKSSALILTAAQGMVACSRPAPVSDDSARAAPDDVRAIAEFVARLKRIEAAAAAAADEKPCPEPTPRKEVFGASLVADSEVLARLASRRPAASATPNDPWRPLTSAVLRELSLGEPKSADAARDLHFSIAELEQRYHHIGVVRATDRVAPELRGAQFITGQFEGWLAVVDFETAAPVCATRFSATNSAEVTGRADDRRSDTIRRDFTMNLGRELDRAATRLSPALTLEHD